MGRVNLISQKFFDHLASKDVLYLHFSSDQLLLAKDSQLVYSQPSCLVFQQAERQVLATGQQALQWHAAVNEELDVQFVYPIKNGTLINDQLAFSYLKSVFQSTLNKTKFFRGTLFWLYQSFLSPWQKQQFTQLFSQFAFFKQQAVALAPAAVASYRLITQEQSTHQAIWVIFLNRDCCEFSLVKGSECVYSQKINFGIETLIDQLKQFFADQMQFYVARAELVRLLRNLSWDDQTRQNKLIQVKGRNQAHKQIQVKTMPLKNLWQVVQQTLNLWQRELSLHQAYFLYNYQSSLGNDDAHQCLLVGQAFKHYSFLKTWLDETGLFAIKQHPEPLYAGLQGLMTYANAQS